MGRITIKDSEGIAASINDESYSLDEMLDDAEQRERRRYEHNTALDAAYERHREIFGTLPEISYDYRPVLYGLPDADPDNKISERTLARENRVAGGSRSKASKRKKTVKPLLPIQRIERHVQAYNKTSPDAFIGETETQRAERMLRQAEHETEELSKRGRPRKGSNVRQVFTGRAEAETLMALRAAGYTPTEAINAFAEAISRVA